MHEATDDGDLLAKMSPLLQGTVAVAANREWLGQIWFLHGMGNTRLEKEFVAALQSMDLAMKNKEMEQAFADYSQPAGKSGELTISQARRDRRGAQ